LYASYFRHIDADIRGVSIHVRLSWVERATYVFVQPQSSHLQHKGNYCLKDPPIFYFIYYAPNTAHKIRTTTMSKNRNRSVYSVFYQNIVTKIWVTLEPRTTIIFSLHIRGIIPRNHPFQWKSWLIILQCFSKRPKSRGTILHSLLQNYTLQSGNKSFDWGKGTSKCRHFAVSVDFLDRNTSNIHLANWNLLVRRHPKSRLAYHISLLSIKVSALCGKKQSNHRAAADRHQTLQIEHVRIIFAPHSLKIRPVYV